MATIMLVDDDDLVRSTIAHTLTGAGHGVVQARNGNEALSAATADIDLIILDILMPERDGIETLRELRQRSSDPPVLAISGGDRTGWIHPLEMASSLGASATLPKPFTPARLLEAVARLLSSKEV
jgi:CheY-like chemotaxis protein